MVAMEPEETPHEHQLPGTVRFVTVMGILFVIGWLLMFHLTSARW